ncbi:MAG TPA: VOC family protein, partial [Planctomycetota bacterium]|nr:VOC family protein [Planctomycetota bacterium]
MALPLDHLVYAVSDLEVGIAHFERLLGVRAAPGGSHRGLGTRNALLSLGPDCYLEIIAPDPEQPDPPRPRPFGVDRLQSGRLVTWAVKAGDLERRVETARRAGYDPGEVRSMSRERPDGMRLEWRLTLRSEPAGDGLVPFLIDWGGTPSPAQQAARGCRLIALRAVHPEVPAVAS